MFDVVEYTRDLIRFDTTNPPGNEAECACFTAETLAAAGFTVEKQAFGDNRMNVIAMLPGSNPDMPPLVLTGHLDTVPLGKSDWSCPPFAADIIDGKLYGRGASDMKSGVAALIGAALNLAKTSDGKPTRGLTLILTSGEETGCAGALHLVEAASSSMGRASAMIVGEPTANQISTAHKGALFMSATTKGVTTHSSQPEQGSNAIYKAAGAITKIEDYGFNEKPHPLLGSPTINVGMVSGGMNVNSVPDHAEFTIDIRTNAMKDHSDFFTDLSGYLGSGVDLEIFTDMPAISTPDTDPFVALVTKVCSDIRGAENVRKPVGLPFFTDASALNSHYQCPTVILGPGEPVTMHQTDEFCYVDRITEALSIYSRLTEEWCL